MSDLTHLDSSGNVRMVDVGGKAVTQRRAVAEGHVRISPVLAEMIRNQTLPKGDLFATVRLAGIQAAKRTSELIPLCHNIPLERVDLQVTVEDCVVRIRAEVAATAKTGVEMEALTAVSVAALTVIDMGKSVDPTMIIGPIRLLEKTGGVRGPFAAPPLSPEHSS